MSSLDIDMPYSFGMSVNMGPSGNMPYDIPDIYNYMNYNYTHIYFHHMEQTVGHPVHTCNIFDSCNILQISDNVSLSWS
jgi:hypothetical protein